MWIQTSEEAPAAATEAGAADAAAAAQAAASETPAPPAAGAAPAVGEDGQPLVVAPGTETDWIPEKFQVKKDDGTVDEGASSRKLAESYKALEAHKGEAPPESADGYKLEAPKDADGNPVAGIDFDGFVADPLFKDFAGRAHAEGLTNKQLQFVTNEYLKLAPELLAASQELSVTEARAELGKLWADDATMSKNLGSVQRAIQGFGGEADDMPGSRARLFEKFGSDPDFIAFAAKVAGEMAEDTTPAAGMSADADVEALMKSTAYTDPNDPQHEATKAKVKDHFDRKYGVTRR